MIEKVTKIGNILIRIVTSLLITVFLLYGCLSLFGIFRTELAAYPSRDLLRFKPTVEAESAPDLDELIAINPDTAAWLTINKTKIDYPVMHGETDSQYLSKDIYGTYTVSGSLFMSSGNKADFSEPYQIIYGHHMENGTMFGDLDKFKNADFFHNSGLRRFKDTEGMLITGGKAYKLYVWAVMETDAYDEVIYDAVKDETEMSDLLTYVKKKAIHIRDVGEIKHLLALSTCNSDSTFGRTILLVKVDTEPEPVPETTETKKTIKRDAEGHSMDGAYWAIMNFLVMALTVVMAFPVHRIKQYKPRLHKIYTAASIALAISSVMVFALTEDIVRPITAIDKYTPVMIALAVMTYGVQHIRWNKIKKGEENSISR